MSKIITFKSRAQGFSHIKKNKVCQDAVLDYSNEEIDHYYCAVSDGHGGDTYFRSDRGSKFLTEITIDALKEFNTNIKDGLFNVSFKEMASKRTIIDEIKAKKDVSVEITDEDRAFHQLFSSIISKWNDAIETDWKSNKPTTEQMLEKNVPQDYIEIFEKDKNIELAYGCTLIAVVRTPKYWFAFQLGDGKCVAFGEDAKWYEPIAYDELCQGSITTSICEPKAIDNFRYSYGNDNFPVAVFIGSDGMDDAYHDMNMLGKLYQAFIESFINKGYDETIKVIDETLPELSRIGQAQDDMSLAGIIDMEGIKKLPPLFREIEKEELKIKIEQKEQEIIKRKQDIEKKLLAKGQEESKINKLEEEKGTLLTSYNNVKNQIESLVKSNEGTVKQKDIINKEIEKLQKKSDIFNQDLERMQLNISKLEKEKEEMLNKLNGDVIEDKEEQKENSTEETEPKKKVLQLINILIVEPRN